jgi:hypothetical protein
MLSQEVSERLRVSTKTARKEAVTVETFLDFLRLVDSSGSAVLRRRTERLEPTTQEEMVVIVLVLGDGEFLK